MTAKLSEAVVVPTTDAAESTKLASRSARLGAVLLDIVINGAFIIAAGSFIAGGFEALMAWSQSASALQTFLANMAGFALLWLLHAYLLATRGQTIGKWLCGIRIVRTDGRPAGLWRIVSLRMLPFALLSSMPIPYIATTFGLADSLLIFRPSRKCLHDQVADTIVVYA